MDVSLQYNASMYTALSPRSLLSLFSLYTFYNVERETAIVRLGYAASPCGFISTQNLGTPYSV